MVDQTPSRRRFLALGSAALAAGIAGCSADTPTSAGAQNETPNETGANETATDADGALESPYAAVYEETIDSVVLVRADQGQGTGFVFDDGHVVTNAHVVGESTTADVRFTEGVWSAGDVVGTDPHSDLAAIAVEERPSAAEPLPFVDDGATVGQEVVAIGNPFNLGGTVTAGIVSGIERSIPAPTGYRIPDAIQTDAAVNPGNSGGPLVDLEGRVVAVINSGGGDNVAFGISAALTQRVVPQLIENGSYEHAYVGAQFADVTPDVAAENDLDEPRGLIVAGVEPGGPAAGTLQPSEEVAVVDDRRVPVGGDVVLAIDGTELATTEDLGSYLALHASPGDTVPLTVLRDGEEQTVELELGTRPEGSSGP